MGLFDAFVNAANLGYQISKDAHLTGAQREANEFSHNEAQLAYERALQADSTKYQRQVSDMKAAGLNPMLAAGGSAGSVQSSPASSVSPSGGDVAGALSLVLQKQQFELEKQRTEAQIRNINADTDKKESETEGQNISNEVATATKDARVAAAALQNELDRGKIKQIDASLDQIAADIKKKAAETETEAEKRSLFAAQRILARAQASQIVEMLPYQKMVAEAQTEKDRQAALLSAAHTAYQNHLIDDGYLDAFIEHEKASASAASSEAAVKAMRAAIRTGDYSKTGDFVTDSIAKDIFQDFTLLLDNINPLNNLFK